MKKARQAGLDPYELLDNVEKELNIDVIPLSWPVSNGPTFKGVYNLYEEKLDLFDPVDKQRVQETTEIRDLDDPRMEQYLGDFARKLKEDLSFIKEVFPPFDVKKYLAGQTAPVFSGSALNNFGVRELLDCFLDIAPYPRSFRSV
jgi:peptide chain release factor 3